jgi:hypothetical protein
MQDSRLLNENHHGLRGNSVDHAQSLQKVIFQITVTMVKMLKTQDLPLSRGFSSENCPEKPVRGRFHL